MSFVRARECVSDCMWMCVCVWLCANVCLLECSIRHQVVVCLYTYFPRSPQYRQWLPSLFRPVVSLFPLSVINLIRYALGIGSRLYIPSETSPSIYSSLYEDVPFWFSCYQRIRPSNNCLRSQTGSTWAESPRYVISINMFIIWITIYHDLSFVIRLVIREDGLTRSWQNAVSIRDLIARSVFHWWLID